MTKGSGQGREDRLKAALKANLARRKAQARARQDETGEDAEDRAPTPPTGDEKNG